MFFGEALTKRRDVVRLLEAYGFHAEGGTKHERFRHADGREVWVPRHREILEFTFKSILRDAGIKNWR
ncbi:hypothetical protein B5F73_03770 [Olsenella sp. An270]|nr:hypothetical protein B5F73_03770 [Olsenella sp. An270]